MNQTRDVIIAGGGLAGLGLAWQLKTERPELDILVLEKARFPRPKAIAKVGESTVEIGSHYLSRELGLARHLQDDHLKKFGIRIFFGEPAADFAQQDELGASQTFGIPTYQIDRGDIENHLAAKVQAAGVEILSETDIHQLDLSGAQKQLQITTPEGSRQLQSRWLLDAAGRASLIKSKAQLARPNNHRAHAVWFRVDRSIIIDQWSNHADWANRVDRKGQRWLSTNHLTGPGYWVWIIPLASGVTSIGIVMDDQVLEESGIKDQASAMAWLHKHQSRCAQAIEGATFLDFVVLRDYSYDCQQLFNDQGWAITGEAGRFADPFYSPGSDFIAFGNGFITDLVSADSRGEDVRLRALVYDKIFKSIYDNTLSLYTGQYGGFGDRRMMGIKLLWDYSYYWGVLSLLFFRRALTDIDAVRRVSPLLLKAQALNQDIQQHFRVRAARRLQLPNAGVFMDQYKIPCLQHFNAVLQADESRDCDADLQQNLLLIERVAEAVIDMLREDASSDISESERELLGDYRKLVLA